MHISALHNMCACMHEVLFHHWMLSSTAWRHEVPYDWVCIWTSWAFSQGLNILNLPGQKEHMPATRNMFWSLLLPSDTTWLAFHMHPTWCNWDISKLLSAQTVRIFEALDERAVRDGWPKVQNWWTNKLQNGLAICETRTLVPIQRWKTRACQSLDMLQSLQNLSPREKSRL